MVQISKQRMGTLTLDGEPFEAQQRSVSIIPPEQSDDQPDEVLSGDPLEDEDPEVWKLGLTAIQDWENPTGFLKFTWDRHGEAVPFVWAPKGAGGPTYAGTVRLSAGLVGGEMNRRTESELEWTITSGKPAWTPAAGA